MKRRILSAFLSLILALSVVLIAPVQVLALPVISNASVTPSFTLVTGQAAIAFKSSENCVAKVEILNSSNAVVRTLPSQNAVAGATVHFTWNGRNTVGNYVAAGVYKVKMYAGQTTKILNTTVLAAAAQLLSGITAPPNIVQPNTAPVTFQISQKNDVFLLLYNSGNVLVSRYVFRDVAPNVLQHYTWDGKATYSVSGNTAGSLVIPGKYRLRFLSNGVYLDKSINVLAQLPRPGSPAIVMSPISYVARWSAVPHATNYEIKVYKGTTLLRTAMTGLTTVYSLTALMKANGSGSYKFTIRAIGSTYYISSARAASATVDYVRLSNLAVNPPLLFINTGETRTLSTVITPAAATNKHLLWTSSNIAVATVSTTGVVTAKAAGTAVIKAVSRDNPAVSDSCVVYVSQKNYLIPDGTYLVRTKVNNRTLTAVVGGTYNIFTGNYSGYTNQRFHFVHIGNGRYQIRSIQTNDRMLLNLQSASTMPPAGTNINLATEISTISRQLWTITKRWDGYFSFTSIYNPNLVMTCLNPGVASSDVRLGNYSATLTSYQHWSLSQIEPVLPIDNTGNWPLSYDHPYLTTWMWPLAIGVNHSTADTNSLRYSVVNLFLASHDETGAIVTAAKSGTVMNVIKSVSPPYGTIVFVRSVVGTTTYFTSYGNLMINSIPGWITPGAYVSQGDIIGRVGSTMNSSTAFLAFGIKIGGSYNTTSGTPVSPLSRSYWNGMDDRRTYLSISYGSAAGVSVKGAGVTSDQTKLYVTISILAKSASPYDKNAKVSKVLYTRRRLTNPSAFTYFTINKIGMLSKLSNQNYYLIVELEDLKTGKTNYLTVPLK